MLCCYFFVYIIDLKEYPFISMVYINECIDVNTALKNSFKSMSCLRRIQQFPRNFLRRQAPGCIQIYSFKSLVPTLNIVFFSFPSVSCTRRFRSFLFSSSTRGQCYKTFSVCNLRMFVIR
jgi:hypothetical protein